MKRSVLYILFCVSFYCASAQNAVQCIALAREQVQLGNDLAARNMYQRVLFFDRKTYGMECYQALANINFRLLDYDRCAFYFDLIYQNSKSDSIKNDALVHKASALLLEGKFTEARRELLYINEQVSANWAYRKNLYLGSCYYGERNFLEAEKMFLQLLQNESDTKVAAVKKLFKKARKINKKKPKTAKVLSMIVPGAGQLYAGDVKNALNSFGLNALMAVWFVATVQNVSFNDAIISTGSWVFRYYAGGYQRAPLLTEEIKDKKLKKNFQAILNAVER